MLQTAKLFARRGSTFDTSSKRVNGLTFGEFCVLAADLKRFRTQNLTHYNSNTKSSLPLSTTTTDANRTTPPTQDTNATSPSLSSSDSTKNNLNNEDPDGENKIKAHSTSTSSVAPDVNAPEVFLGGSCNPTTWRADVAIPALDKLGISFYNPVSQQLHNIAAYNC